MKSRKCVLLTITISRPAIIQYDMTGKSNAKKDCFAQPKAKLSNTIQSTPTQINEEYDAEIPLDTMEFVLFR